MSLNTLPQRRSAPKELKLTIVASRFNEELSDALLEHCLDELDRLNPHCILNVLRVPGAHEVPLAVARLLKQQSSLDALIALGVILQGATNHAELIAGNVSRTLMDLSLAHDTPVINQVLCFQSPEDAAERCQGTEINRGIEAARAALGVLDDLARIEQMK